MTLSRFFRRINQAIFIVLLCFFLIVSCHKNQERGSARVGLFPDPQSNIYLNIVLSDILSEQFDSCYTYIIAPEWISNNLEWDSLKSSGYLERHFHRLGIDVYHLVKLNSAGMKRCEIKSFSTDADSGIRSFRIEEKNMNEIIAQAVQYVLPSDSFFKSSLQDCPPYPIWERIGQARINHLKGDFEGAVQIWRDLLMMDSQSSYVYKSAIKSLLAWALDIRRNNGYTEHIYLEIEFLLRKLKDLTSDDPTVDHLYGRMYIQRAFWNKAQSSLTEAAQKMPGHPYIMYDMAHMHASRYRILGYRNKEHILKDVLAIHPGLDEAWLMLGHYYFQKGKIKNAEDTFLQMLKYHPGSMDGLLALGKLYMFRNDFVKIVEIYEKILKQKSEFSPAYYNLGITYLRDEKKETAEAFFKRAISIDDHADAHYYLGILLNEKGEHDSALVHFRTRVSKRTGQNDEFADEALHMIRKIESYK